jgi:hypothetical protein
MFKRLLPPWTATTTVTPSSRPHRNGKLPPLDKIMLPHNYEVKYILKVCVVWIVIYIYYLESVLFFWKSLIYFLLLAQSSVVCHVCLSQEVEHFHHLAEHPPKHQPFYLEKEICKYYLWVRQHEPRPSIWSMEIIHFSVIQQWIQIQKSKQNNTK